VAQRTFFGMLRIALLLAMLLFVAVGAWLDHARTTAWTDTLRITVYPVAAADDADLRSYVASLDESAFLDTEQFFRLQAARHGLALADPVRVRVSHAAPGPPPSPPSTPGPLSIAVWSLKMRHWAERVAAHDPLPPPDVQVFAVFHASDGNHALPDSLGLSKGLVAVTHLYAGTTAVGSNQVVLAHELLHTLGATDKYDPATGQPRAPDGLGDPLQEPRYPQRSAELMAGRIALTAHEAVIPESLRQTNIGPVTAREIGWAR